MDSKTDSEKFRDWADVFNARFRVSKYWNSFINKVKYSNRFFVDEDIDRLLSFLLLSTEVIQKKTEFYRARLLSPTNYKDLKIETNEQGDKNLLALTESKMKSPPKGDASSGRANPAGISYLYLASNPQTACAEVRPISADLISVMPFVIKHDTKVVNLVSVEKGCRSSEEYYFIEKVMTAFMLPTREQNDIEYAPTQFIASYLQNKGFDGIKYGTFSDNNPSSFNLVLFDENIVTGSEKSNGYGEVYRVVSKKYGFQNLSGFSNEVVTSETGCERLGHKEIDQLIQRLFVFQKGIDGE